MINTRPRALDLAVIAALLALLTAASVSRIWVTDYWWQKKTGELVVASGPPSVDPFSYTAENREWIEMRWVFCALQYLSDKAAGEAGPIALKWIALAATFALAGLAAARRGNAVLVAVPLVLAMLASIHRFLVRPELATLFFLTLFVFVIERHRRRGGWGLFLLPLLQIVWTNTHTVFILGPLVCGLYFLTVAARALRRPRSPNPSDDRDAVRHAGLLVVLTALACLLNPYGWKGASFPFLLLKELRETAVGVHIGEMRSPFESSHPAMIFYKALLIVTLASAAANLRRLDPFKALLCAAMFYLSFLAIRNVPLFAVVAVPFVVDNVQGASWPNRGAIPTFVPLLRRVAGLAVIAICVVTSWGLVTDRLRVRYDDPLRFGVGLAEHRYPIRAVSFLREHGIEGPIFSSLFDASYLLSQGYQVFYDPRLEVYGATELTRYLRVLEAGEEWQDVVQQFGIKSALMSISQLDFIRKVRDSGWALVYWDETAAVLLSPQAEAKAAAAPIQSPAQIEASIEALRAHLPEPRAFRRLCLLESASSPLPYHQVACFLIEMGWEAQAEPFLKDAISAYPGVVGARLSYAQILENRGDAEGAQREYEAAYERSPDNPDVICLLGRHRVSQGDNRNGVALLERCVEERPDDALSWAFLAHAHQQEGRSVEASRCLEQAIELDPSNIAMRKNLARVYFSRGLVQEARACLEAARRVAPDDPELAEFLGRLEQ